MIKKALLAVAVAMITITSCGGSGKQVVDTYCRVFKGDNGFYMAYGQVYLVFSDGTTKMLVNDQAPDSKLPVTCFAGQFVVDLS